MMHWAAQYILHNPPIKWESGAQGPLAYDCWSFFRMIQKKHFSRDVPIVEVDADKGEEVRAAFRNGRMYEGWEEVDIPRNGDGVVFLGGEDNDHVGIWLDVDMGGILHCIRKSGVVFTRREVVRRMGWGRVEFYRYQGEV